MTILNFYGYFMHEDDNHSVIYVKVPYDTKYCSATTLV